MYIYRTFSMIAPIAGSLMLV